MRGLIQKIAWMVAVALSAGLLMAGVASAGAPQAKSKKTKQPAKQEQPQDQTDQPEDQQKPADQKPADQQPQDQPTKPLFTGKVKLTSSRQGKGTATAGFNGVGQDGKVKEALLNANPSPDAKAKAAQLTLVEADAAEVQAFAKEGKLNPPPGKSGDKKGK